MSAVRWLKGDFCENFCVPPATWPRARQAATVFRGIACTSATTRSVAANSPENTKHEFHCESASMVSRAGSAVRGPPKAAAPHRLSTSQPALLDLRGSMWHINQVHTGLGWNCGRNAHSQWPNMTRQSEWCGARGLADSKGLAVARHGYFAQAGYRMAHAISRRKKKAQGIGVCAVLSGRGASQPLGQCPAAGA